MIVKTILIILLIIAISIFFSGCFKAPDTDGDGHRDPVDDFPKDPNDWKDSDKDGIKDANEWADTDGDGYGDNSDKYPADPLYHTSVLKTITNFSYEEIDRVTIYENGSSGTEYTISVTNNDIFSGNFTTTVNTCNCVDWSKEECIPDTYLNVSTIAYVESNETEMVKVRVFSDYINQRRTFKYWINVTSSEVEQPS